MQKGRVMLRAAGGIPYELTRGRVKRLNLHVRRDGTVALSIPLRTTLEAADAYVIAEAEWIRAAQARQAAREKRQEELPDKAIALAHFTAMSDKVYPAFAGVRAEAHHQSAQYDQPLGRLPYGEAPDHLRAPALQYARGGTDLCGSA